MTALPPILDVTGSSTTEAKAKTWLTNLRAYLAGLLGTDGTPNTAISTLFSSGDGKIPESMLPDGPYIDGASFLGISDFPLFEVLAASTYSLLEMFGTFPALMQTTSTAYTIAYTLTVPSNLSGVLRASCGHHISGSGTAYLQLLKNGALVETWTTTSGSSTLRTADVTISPGDVLTWQHKSSSSAVTITASGVAAKGDKGFVIANAYKIVG